MGILKTIQGMPRFIGPSTGMLYKWAPDSLLERFTKLTELSPQLGLSALEINLGVRQNYMMGALSRLTDRVLSWNLAQMFGFRSVHLPVDLMFPDPEANRILPGFLELVDAFEAHAVVVHPDRVLDWKFFYSLFGNRISIENLGRDGNGQDPQDYREVYERYPDMLSTYDGNHEMDVDPTGEKGLRNKLLAIVGGKVSHLHVSALTPQGNKRTHRLFNEPGCTDQLTKLAGLPVCPVIHEGVMDVEPGAADSVLIHILRHEFEMVSNSL